MRMFPVCLEPETIVETGIGESQVGQGLMDDTRELGLHLEVSGEPWESFQPQSDIVIFGKILLAT